MRGLRFVLCGSSARKLPKLYWCDPGLARATRASTAPLAPEERGALFEGLIAQVLRACKDYQHLFDNIYYWEPAQRRATEVDFLLERGGEFTAVEAKTGRTFSEFIAQLDTGVFWR